MKCLKQIALGVLLTVLALGVILSAHSQRFFGRVGLALHANTFTNLIPTFYEALDIVSRELIGFIPASFRDFNAARVGINQLVNVFITPPTSTSNITPGTNAPDDGDQTMGNVQVTITKSKYAPVRWTGEEQLLMAGSGQSSAVIRDQFVEAMRAIANEVEVDLATEAYKTASRAFGTAGTAPFGTANDLSDIAQLKKILDDNGAPRSGRRLVLGTTAMANIGGKQSSLFKVNEAGSDALLRQGIVGFLQGFAIGDSAAVVTTVKGTGTAYTTTAAGFAVGTTSIPLITGSGTIVVGDVVTFAGDTNKYIVQTGIAAPGTIVINAPGLRQAIPASATAVTVGNNAAQNVAISGRALVLAARMPAMPEGGDSASDVTTITDPNSGLMLQVAMYKQYRRVKFEVGLAWGVKGIKPEHSTVLLG